MNTEKQELQSLLKTAKRIHFVGIGGISMSALAEILLNKGYTVSGSDIKESDLTNHLKDLNVKIYIGHNKTNIDHADIIIYTAAVKPDNAELVAAKENNIPAFERATLLGVIMKDYSYSIAVSGTHGKTTTTSMISQVLLSAKKDPTCLVGGQLSSIGGNIRIGSHDTLVTEACEYVDSFLSMSPNIAVVLNIEADHLDYFKDIEQIKQSFHTFINLAGKDGLCIACGDDPNVCDVCKDVLPNVMKYGITGKHLDVSARNIFVGKNRCPEFDIFYQDKLFAHINLNIPGQHNILNSLACCAVCITLGISAAQFKAGIEPFRGTRRRFEYIGEYNGAVVIDDYAHHPTEITATLKAARAMNYEHIYCIFQPHTYTRTIAFFDDFVNALSLADTTILADIYAAREKNLTGISSKNLADKIAHALYFDSFDKIVDHIKSVARKGDLIITMGAGSIYQVYELLLGKENCTASNK